MNRGPSNRGARGAATNARGSTFRGRGRGAPRGGSSSKFSDPQYPRSDRDGAYIPKGPRRPKRPWIDAADMMEIDSPQPNISSGHPNRKRRSNYPTGSTPEPATTNSFEADRIANAARREQRGQRGGGNASIRGAPDSRGAFRNKSVRFGSPPTTQNAPQQPKMNFGQQPKFGPKPGEKPFIIPKKPGSLHPKSKLSQSITISSSDDEHVTKIKNTLQHNGLLNDPAWPMAQPGDPRQNSAVKDFWMKMKEHRARVRKVLMNAGLIDDPDKPKKLSEAIDFKGTCEEMCPRFEQITRIMEHDVKNLEREMGPDGTLWPNPQKMIKAYGRSSAGQDAPLPDDIRTPGALRRTLDYMIRDILGDQNNLPTVHNFLWDRTRSIRRDFTFQQASLTSTDYADEVYCLETIARFHVVALHQMSDPSNTSSDFSEHQEIEQLGRTLLSLIHTYEDCKALGISCPNEAEFRAYHLVYHARNPAMMESVQDWGRDFWTSDTIQTAISLVECLHNIWEINGPLKPHSASDIAMNFCNRFFAILQQPDISYVMACFAELHFNSVRKATLTTILSAYRKQRDQTTDWSVSALNSYLHFDSLDDVEAFVEAHGLNITDNAGINYLDFDTAGAPIEPETKVKQPHSKSIVERKRGHKSLPECIYFNAYIPEGAYNDDDSLFVPQAEVPFGFRQGPHTATQISSSSFGQSAAAAPSFGSHAPSTTAINTNKFGAFVDSDEDQPANPTTASQGSAFSFGAQATSQAPLFNQQSTVGSQWKATPPTTPSPFGGNIFGQAAQTQASQNSIAPQEPGGGPSLKPGTPNQGQGSSTHAEEQLISPDSKLEPAKPFSGFNFGSQAPISSPSPQKEDTKAALNFSFGAPKQSGETVKPLFQPAAPSPPISSPALPPQAHSFFPVNKSSSTPSGEKDHTASAPSLFSGLASTQPASSSPFMFAPKQADAANESGDTPQPSSPPFAQAQSQPQAFAPLGSLGNYPVSAPPASNTTQAPTSEATRYNWLASGTASKTAENIPPVPSSSPSAQAQTTTPQSTISPPVVPTSKTAGEKVPLSLARWVLMDDGGILDQFLVKEIEKACQGAFDDAEKEVALQLEKEAEELQKDRKRARKFRKKSLAVKYFYLWRDNARKRALLARGRQARELRQKMAEESRLKKLREKQNIVSDFAKSIGVSRNNKRKLQDEEEMLNATGVLNGIRNPALAASRIVHGDMGPPRSTTPLGSPTRGHFAKSNSSFNQSTASLQSLVDGDHIPKTNGASLRRSLSDSRQRGRSQSSELAASRSLSGSRRNHLSTSYTYASPKPNNVETDYFRLKARGIQTLPNGRPIAKAALLGLDMPHDSEEEEIERPLSRVSQAPRSFGSSTRSTPDQGLKRSISGLALSGPAKRARATPIPAPKPDSWREIEEIKERARRVMRENAHGRESDEYGLKRSTTTKSEAQREAEMQELFRRSARVKEEMAKGQEWYKSQRESMSRSMSRADSEQVEQRRQGPTSAPTLPKPPATGPMSFGTPVKTAARPPQQQQPPQQKKQEVVDIIDLSD